MSVWILLETIRITYFPLSVIGLASDLPNNAVRRRTLPNSIINFVSQIFQRQATAYKLGSSASFLYSFYILNLGQVLHFYILILYSKIFILFPLPSPVRRGGG